MLSRALISATVMLLIGSFTAIPVRAENLEAGKSPSQIFAGTCSACHKGMRGLVKTVAPGSLPGFLRQHYTTSSDMAGMLSAYLLSNGASDARSGGGLTKQGREAKSDAKSEPKPAAAPEQAESRPGRRQHSATPQEAGKPDADGTTGQRESSGEPKGEPSAHGGRHARRLAKPSQDSPETDKPTVEERPAAASDTPGDRPVSARHKLSKRGRSGKEEPPKADAAKDESPKGEAAKVEPAQTEPAKEAPPKDDAAKTGAAKSDDEVKAEAAKADAVKAEGIKLLRDPVPPVTPAPKPSESEAKPDQAAAPAPTASVASVPPASGNASHSSATPPAVAAKPMAPAAEPAAPSPTAPPTPPISQ